MTVTRKNQFEELIDALMIEEVSGLDQEIRETLEGLPIEKKRLAILSILDKDRDMFMKIKKMVDSNCVTKAEHIVSSSRVNGLPEVEELNGLNDIKVKIPNIGELIENLEAEIESEINSKLSKKEFLLKNID